MTTPLSSPIFLIRFRPMMVFLAPSSSDMPARFPENVIMLGIPDLAATRDVFAEVLFDLGVIFHAVEGVRKCHRLRRNPWQQTNPKRPGTS